MQMADPDVVHIFLRAVARAPHVADHVARLHGFAQAQPGRIRPVLAQMGIVVIPLGVEAPDADAPSAVLVPAEGLHNAGLHRNHRRSGGRHHVVPQVGPREAVGPGRAEIVVLLVGKPLRNRRKSGQAVLFLSVFQVGARQAAQRRPVRLAVIGEGIQPLCRFLKALRLQLFCEHVHIGAFIPVELAAVFGPQAREKVDPAQVPALPVRFDVECQRLFHGQVGHVEIDPFDERILFRRAGLLPGLRLRREGLLRRHGRHGQQHGRQQNQHGRFLQPVKLAAQISSPAVPSSFLCGAAGK